jgi:uncharacterized protein
MLLDLNKLHSAAEHVERTLQPVAFDPPDELYRVATPVELSMDVEKTAADAFRVTGQVRTGLQLDCSRCVEPFEIPIEAAFDLRYVPQSQNQGEGEHEIREEDLATAYYREGMLDITDLLREQFQLVLPMKPLCNEDCRGLCAVCGANLNRVECGHSPKWDDPRLAPLKELLNHQEEN